MQNKTWSQLWNRWIVIFTAFSIFLLGLFSLLLQNSTYFFSKPHPLIALYFGMLNEIALSFCFAGVALLSALFQWRYTTRIMACLLMIISIKNIFEYVFQIDLFPVGDLEKIQLSQAICFLLAGIALWTMLGRYVSSRYTIFFANCIGALLPGVAVLSLFGDILQAEVTYTYGLGILSPLSTNISIGFILLGVGITSLMPQMSQRSGFEPEQSSPLLVAILVALVSLLFWHLLIRHQRLENFTPDMVLIAVIKEFGISLLIGVATYFLQSARYHAKNAEYSLKIAKIAEDRLLRQATHDELTGLANRVLLLDHIEKSIAYAQREDQKIALLFFDLNGFKYVNDSMGHDVGDALLKLVAKRLLGVTRQEDTLARLGGDEFVLLVVNVQEEKNMSPLIERYLSVFSQPFYVDTQALHLGCSMGISLYPKDGTEATQLLKNADIAMYKAKRNKQPFQFYTLEMQIQIVDRVSLENELREGLVRNEFMLHYQPIIHALDSIICSVEALIRWNSPNRGLVTPEVFIPITEETGLIIPIGEWVLQTACAQNKIWQEKGLLTASINVNISGKQIKQKNFCHLVQDSLERVELEPSCLTLELTETILMDDMPDVQSTLKTLKDIQVKLSIDDFGIAYSSLSRLKHLPVSKLKIDKSFLREVPQNKEDTAIVLTIIAMAKNLNLRVVAEGVETREQMDFLRKNGCDELQGYYISRPLPLDQFEKFIRDTSYSICNSPGTPYF